MNRLQEHIIELENRVEDLNKEERKIINQEALIKQYNNEIEE